MVLFNDKNIIGGTFPNGEKYYNKARLFFHDHCDTFTLIFENNEDIFDLLFYKKYYDELVSYPKPNELCIYFCCYAQMDRPIDGKVFSFKYFAQLINDANFNRVIIYDPHSRVVESSINKCVILYPALPSGYELYFYPDEGSRAKYSEVYPNAKYRYGMKKRNLDTGEIISYEIIADKEDIEGKKILIRDDLIIHGGTYKYAAKALREMGAAQVDLYITHTMPSAKDFYENLKENGIDNYYTANTLRLPWIKQESVKF